jgi:hypothetical protein
MFMGAVMAVYDGRVFVPESPIQLRKNRRVILSFNEESLSPATPFHLTATQKAEQDRRDTEIINRNADRLNKEALDVLEYQVDIF